MICADWCEKNCVGKYGWYFEPEVNDVYVGFEHQMDMFMFQLYWAERFRREQCL